MHANVGQISQSHSAVGFSTQPHDNQQMEPGLRGDSHVDTIMSIPDTSHDHQLLNSIPPSLILKLQAASNVPSPHTSSKSTLQDNQYESPCDFNSTSSMPILQIIVQKPDRSLDFNTPILHPLDFSKPSSSLVLDTVSITEVFSVYSRASGVPLCSLMALSFITAFHEGETFEKIFGSSIGPGQKRGSGGNRLSDLCQDE